MSDKLNMDGWVECFCGTVRPLLGPVWWMFEQQAWRCRSCEVADMYQDANRCPETITMPDGMVGCRLSWAHKGPFQPDPVKES